MSRIHGLIPAGGVGARAIAQDAQGSCQRTPKQYRLIQGKPMLVHAVCALLADTRVQDVVVGVQADDTQAASCLRDVPGAAVLHSAGPTRALTVLQTLEASAFAAEDWVLVHDAARPGLPVERLAALIDGCLACDQGGLLAMPAADTVKMAMPPSGTCAPMAQVQSTLARASIWLAQTPQMFRVGELKQALSGAIEAGVDVTDEASAMEWMGCQPLLVPGSPRNLKVTWPEDFARVGELP